jgi:hypothetical protein
MEGQGHMHQPKFFLQKKVSINNRLEFTEGVRDGGVGVDELFLNASRDMNLLRHCLLR